MEDKQRKPRESYKISQEDFVCIWTTSNSTKELVERMSALAGKPVPANVLHARATGYRKKGVNLKYMRDTAAAAANEEPAALAA